MKPLKPSPDRALSRSEMKRYSALALIPSEALCADCAKCMGGIFPEGSQVTVHAGECPYCKRTDQTLVPPSDFRWPAAGRKAVFD